MADEISINATLAYEDSEGTTVSLDVADAQFNVSTKKTLRLKQAIPITEVAINLGGISAPGYAFFINRDTTNYIELKTGTGGDVFARLDPDTDGNGKGGVAMLKLGADAQAPFAIANTSPCQLDVLICST